MSTSFKFKGNKELMEKVLVKEMVRVRGGDRSELVVVSAVVVLVVVDWWFWLRYSRHRRLW